MSKSTAFSNFYYCKKTVPLLNSETTLITSNPPVTKIYSVFNDQSTSELDDTLKFHLKDSSIKTIEKSTLLTETNLTKSRTSKEKRN